MPEEQRRMLTIAKEMAGQGSCQGKDKAFLRECKDVYGFLPSQMPAPELRECKKLLSRAAVGAKQGARSEPE